MGLMDDSDAVKFGIPKIKNGSHRNNESLNYNRRSSLQLVSEEND